MKGTGKQAWRDTHVKIKGAAVYGLQRAFLVDWFFVCRALITDRSYYPGDNNRGKRLSGSDCHEQSDESFGLEIEQGYVSVLCSAKHYVYMETPLFLAY